MKPKKPTINMRVASLFGLGHLSALRRRVAKRRTGIADTLSPSKKKPAPASAAGRPAKLTMALNKPSAAPRQAGAEITPASASRADIAAEIKRARSEERERCRQIMAIGIDKGAIRTACACAFDTNLSASQAEAAINAKSLDEADVSNRRPSLSERMAQVSIPVIGPDGGDNPDASPRGQVMRIMNAVDKARNGT